MPEVRQRHENDMKSNWWIQKDWALEKVECAQNLKLNIKN